MISNTFLNVFFSFNERIKGFNFTVGDVINYIQKRKVIFLK
jgi:hypothetical protein